MYEYISERERERANQMAEGHLAQEKGGTVKCLHMFAPMCKRISGPFKKTRSMRLCVLKILVYRVFAYGAILTY